MGGGQGHQGRRWKAKQREQQMEWRYTDVNEYQQWAITGTTMSHSTEAWGDKMSDKREGRICRIGLLSPSGFILMGGSTKDDQLKSLLKQMEVDVMCFPEVNVCWHKLMPCNSRLEERTLGWLKMMH